MNVYELIKNNNKLVGTFIRNGLINLSLANNFEVYQYYLDLREIGKKKSHAVQIAAIHYDLSDRYVFSIVKSMEEVVI